MYKMNLILLFPLITVCFVSIQQSHADRLAEVLKANGVIKEADVQQSRTLALSEILKANGIIKEKATDFSPEIQCGIAASYIYSEKYKEYEKIEKSELAKTMIPFSLDPVSWHWSFLPRTVVDTTKINPEKSTVTSVEDLQLSANSALIFPTKIGKSEGLVLAHKGSVHFFDYSKFGTLKSIINFCEDEVYILSIPKLGIQVPLNGKKLCPVADGYLPSIEILSQREISEFFNQNIKAKNYVIEGEFFSDGVALNVLHYFLRGAIGDTYDIVNYILSSGTAAYYNHKGQEKLFIELMNSCRNTVLPANNFFASIRENCAVIGERKSLFSESIKSYLKQADVKFPMY